MEKSKDKKVRIEVHFSKEVADKIKKVADSEGRSRKNFCEYSVLKNIKDYKRTEKLQPTHDC